ncbi:MAG: class I SAM-dependent methyltransferase [Steroidobacteraceae bacterium]
MRWTHKARIQRLCARLPGGDQLYYQIQRRLGGLSGEPDPSRALRECALMVRELNESGHPVADARVLEVGTGRFIEVPLGFYLAGAASTMTVDLHRYLRADLVMASIRAMRSRLQFLLETFQPISSAGLDRRLAQLLACQSLAEILELARISYIAPADARCLPVEARSIDIHTSFTVFEHIPRASLIDILKEAARVLAPEGVALHRIDISDHYAHDDQSIALINFLQFSQAEWDLLADNRFAYHNRLRLQDYRDIYREAGHQILDWTERRDQRSTELLRAGFVLDPAFEAHPRKDLEVVGIRVISR